MGRKRKPPPPHTHTHTHRAVHSQNVHLIAPVEDGNVQLNMLQAWHTVNAGLGNARASRPVT
jgi:hypothetical protein